MKLIPGKLYKIKQEIFYTDNAFAIGSPGYKALKKDSLVMFIEKLEQGNFDCLSFLFKDKIIHITITNDNITIKKYLSIFKIIK